MKPYINKSQHQQVQLSSPLLSQDFTTTPTTTEIQKKVWTTSKNQTSHDRQATSFFLELRSKYNREFTDKKTNKNAIWQKIADEMNAKHFFVGEGVEGREKCRQKFSNLESSYKKYVDKKNSTGEGKVDKPPFFEVLDGLLGKKHKISPVLIYDTLKEINPEVPKASSISQVVNDDASNRIVGCTENLPANTEKNTATNNMTTSHSQNCSSVASTSQGTRNRFNNTKTTIRPNKNEIFQKIYETTVETRNTNQKNFENLMRFLNTESERRHLEVMAVLEKINKKRKRRRSSSDEED